MCCSVLASHPCPDMCATATQVLAEGATFSIDAAWLAEIVPIERHHKAQRRTLQLLAAVLAADQYVGSSHSACHAFESCAAGTRCAAITKSFLGRAGINPLE